MIALQLYWINSSMNSRQVGFKHEVNAVLDDVILELEIDDVILELERRGNLQDIDMGINSDPLVIEMDAKSESGFEISIKDKLKDKTVNSQIIDLADNNPTITLMADSLLSGQMGDFGKEQSKILKQTEIFEDILGGKVSIEISKGIEERLDLDIIDSLIRAGLKERSINTSFVFGVFDEKNNSFALGETATEFAQNLKGSIATYSAKLFPRKITPKTYFLRVFFPKQSQYLFHSMDTLLLMSALIIVAVVLAFYYSIKTIFRQKKLGEMKNDFINNMTHELKTPISTISLACEALRDPDMRSSEKQVSSFINMINSENKRLGVLVENVLRSALLDAEEMPFKINPVDINEVISSVSKSLAIRIKKYNGKIKTDLDINTPIIEGDSVHLTNMIYNMLDNAIKYSPDGPHIHISSKDAGDNVVIEISDTGIGINKENQKKIFDKLYRVPTGNVHDVKGFGLGLNYVKTIVEKHFGTIDVQSELKKGSRFTIIIPKKHEKHH